MTGPAMDGYTVESDVDGSMQLVCSECVSAVGDGYWGAFDPAPTLERLIEVAGGHERYRHRFGRTGNPAPPTGRAG